MMIAISNTTSDGGARYFIVQHVPDPFRREPRNVGVIVEREGRSAAKFFGERAPGDVDGRTIKWIAAPDVYRQWVRFWRRAITTPQRTDRLAQVLTESNGEHYSVIDAGFISGTENDPIDDVCNYVYGLLVSDGGLVEALGGRLDPDESLANLRREITSEFREHGLIGESTLFLPHPIRIDIPILGNTRSHTFTYVQDGPAMRLMEPVSFITRNKKAAKDHAGWASQAFADVKRKLNKQVMPVAIVRYTEEDKNDDLVTYSLDTLHDNADVVDWNDASSRSRLLKECVAASGTQG